MSFSSLARFSFFMLFVLFANFCDARINFVHVPKYGGTTIYELLKENFPESEIYPHRKVKKGRVMSYNLQDMQDVFREFPNIHHKVVAGHFPMWFFLEKDNTYDQSFFFAVLRDPVERVLSQYRDRLRNAKKEISPLDVPSNMMCKMFCSDNTLEGEELLQNSIQNLNRMDYVIFMDTFDRDVAHLFRRLGLKLGKSVPKFNSTEKTYVSPEMISKIKELNELDIRFYEYAKQRFQKGTH